LLKSGSCLKINANANAAVCCTRKKVYLNIRKVTYKLLYSNPRNIFVLGISIGSKKAKIKKKR